MNDSTNTAGLVDICTVAVEKNLPKQERLLEYIRQIKDPLRFKCGQCTFTVIYPEDCQSFEDCLRGAVL